jgi:aryl-alcohol dehydrogenase-like predicted oxidoreductase
MKYREFGNTGLSVSEIGMGTMRLTADAAHMPQQLKSSGSAADLINAEARKVLETALDAGVNCFHSSQDYGTWWLLGEVLSTRPERNDIHHVIKVTSPDYDESSFDPELVRNSVELALTALHTERISFVQHLHRGPQVSPSEAYSQEGDFRRIARLMESEAEIQETFDDLKQQGKIGAVVAFPHTMGFLETSLETNIYTGVVHFLNLIETEIVPLLLRMESESMGFFALRPLLQGMLNENRLERANLDRSDPATLPIWDSRYAVLDKVLGAIDRDDSTLSSFALRFALSFEQVSSVISSPRDSNHLREMLEASEAERLSPSDLKTIRELTVEADNFSKYDLFPENQVV